MNKEGIEVSGVHNLAEFRMLFTFDLWGEIEQQK